MLIFEKNKAYDVYFHRQILCIETNMAHQVKLSYFIWWSFKTAKQMIFFKDEFMHEIEYLYVKVKIIGQTCSLWYMGMGSIVPRDGNKPCIISSCLCA